MSIACIRSDSLHVQLFGRGFARLDTGTHESLEKSEYDHYRAAPMSTP